MLRTRSYETESLDNLNLKGKDLNETLSGLAVINKLLGNTASTFKAVKKRLKKNPIESQCIIDLGCGGGDNLRKIAQWCATKNRTVTLIGIDGNANILEYAQQKNTDIIDVKYLKADILDPLFTIQNCDILISSHFMYHFSNDELIAFLIKMKSCVNHTIIFSDLYRSPTAHFLFKWFGFLMPFNTMVKKDGLKAIERSFTKGELENILQEAGIKSYTIQYKWIFRYLLTINL